MARRVLLQRGQRLRRAHRSEGSAALQRRSTTSGLWTKATTTSSPAAASWAISAWACMGAGEASSWFDAKIIDGAVNDVGWITRAVGDDFDLVG